MSNYEGPHSLGWQRSGYLSINIDTSSFISDAKKIMSSDFAVVIWGAKQSAHCSQFNFRGFDQIRKQSLAQPQQKAGLSRDTVIGPPIDFAGAANVGYAGCIRSILTERRRSGLG